MVITRQLLEANEARALAPYGLKSRDSRGRAWAEDEHPYRTAFQRDRDRIIHTTAFRRLEYKTQVFVNYEGDYYRTRLTHTLEVAQIGRTIARALGVNEDLVETICLAHDLGHPPFGHSGEYALDRLMKEHGGFNHNKQSLRIVTELERRYPDFPGLNLTWETREGIVKHETDYDVSDSSDYDPELRGHAEAQIANIADELAYTTHDLDDGLRSGLITTATVDGSGLWEAVKTNVGWPGGALQSNVLDDLTRHRLIRRLVGMEVTDLVEATSTRIEASGATAALDLQKLDHNVVGWSDDFARKNKELKKLLFDNMYRHYRVVRMATKAEKFISDLFNAYVSEPAQLPPGARRRVDEMGLHRAVCDYIAGMTDRYALDEHAKLFDPYERP
jgi:dGTPase